MGYRAAAGRAGAISASAYRRSHRQRASDVAGGFRRMSGRAAHDAAVGRARRRRLSRDPAGGHRRHHHRQLDPDRRARSRRSISRSPTGRLCRGAAELAAARRAAGAIAGPSALQLPLPAPRATLVVENVVRTRPGAQKLRGADVNFFLKAGQRARHRRPERLGQVFAGARAGRRMAARRAARPARRRGARSMVAGGARAAHRLSAAGRRAVRRHVAENIARFSTTIRRSEAVIAAAKAAGVHELIVSLPEATNTQSANAARRSRPASGSASRWPARSTASRSWSCSTSRIPISMPKARRR